jgi:hypothetical protein
MQLFYPSRYVHWEEVVIPHKDKHGEEELVRMTGSAACPGFIPVFGSYEAARAQFPELDVVIQSLTIEDHVGSPQQDDEKHESSLEESQA